MRILLPPPLWCQGRSPLAREGPSPLARGAGRGQDAGSGPRRHGRPMPPLGVPGWAAGCERARGCHL